MSIKHGKRREPNFWLTVSDRAAKLAAKNLAAIAPVNGNRRKIPPIGLGEQYEYQTG